MFSLARWYDNYQAPCVLMIDDLSDALIEAYQESYKNDWGYLTDTQGSVWRFLEDELLSKFPEIKITFFVPYLKHGVISEVSPYKISKYAFGERPVYTQFLQKLVSLGHEIAHHGSNHGAYHDPHISNITHNWTHEWALFDSVEEGVKITQEGVKRFATLGNIPVVGGKYCGYIAIANSHHIIDQCHFLYWCEGVNYLTKTYLPSFKGESHYLSFPTNFAGNSFVRLTYTTNDPSRDRKKAFLKFLQPLYSLKMVKELKYLYDHGHIISIQEHISPSTTWGLVQSSNIVSDIVSLRKIFQFLSRRSIWYATCATIARYCHIRDSATLQWDEQSLTIHVRSPYASEQTLLTIISDREITLQYDHALYPTYKKNGIHIVSVPVKEGENIFQIAKGV